MDDLRSQDPSETTATGPLTSYAQNFEDVMLWRALKHVARGFYIDIGAQDPVIDSVSLGLYEKGWRGVHVEPAPDYAEKLRLARPDEPVHQVAVAAEAGTLSFFEIKATGLSTADAAIAEKHRQAGFSLQTVTVPSVTLASLLDAHRDRDIHWLKIDVEGLEGQVIESWGDSPVRPWLVIVESTLPGTQIGNSLEWEKLLLEKSYRPVYFDGLNRFYLAAGHDSLAVHFQTGPNCFDDVVLSGTSTNRLGRLLTNQIYAKQCLLDEALAREQENYESFVTSQEKLAAAETDLLVQHRAAQHYEAESRLFRERLDALYRTYVTLTQTSELQREAMQQEMADARIDRDATRRAAEAEAHSFQERIAAALAERSAGLAALHAEELQRIAAEHHSHCRALRQEQDALRDQLNALRRERDALINSHSWRLTRPLRVAIRLAARSLRLARRILSPAPPPSPPSLA